MKTSILKTFGILTALMISFAINPICLRAQEEATEKPAKKKADKPVRNPWEAGMLIETQTDLVWAPKTLEFVIQHRFGELNSGTFDLAGLYAPSNIRIALNYGLFKNAQIGIGTTKDNKLQDLNWKYKILTQTKSGSMPIALTYYGNVEYDARDKENFGASAEYKSSYRMSYFNQLIISRKFSKAVTAQITGSYAHYNLVDSVFTPDLKHDNFAVGVAGRVKISRQTSIIVEYDVPLTTPDYIKPNYSIGVEMATSSHAFHIFITTYDGISPQRNLTYNTNDFFKGDFLIGFNITRNWNF
ncbi:MAG: hypothetical protein GXO89_01670 [Chlorobi bacterium]|nr:hypothetical protein [Chlorobiota bacterium]